MNITVDATNYFKQRLKKLTAKKPELRVLLRNSIALLSQDEFYAQSLKLHKLKGDLKDCFSFSLTYKLRVIFLREGNKITLLNIGPHDEVY